MHTELFQDWTISAQPFALVNNATEPQLEILLSSNTVTKLTHFT